MFSENTSCCIERRIHLIFMHLNDIHFKIMRAPDLQILLYNMKNISLALILVLQLKFVILLLKTTFFIVKRFFHQFVDVLIPISKLFVVYTLWFLILRNLVKSAASRSGEINMDPKLWLTHMHNHIQLHKHNTPLPSFQSFREEI